MAGVRYFSVFLLGLAIVTAALSLYVYATCWPLLILDDFQILLRSWTLRASWDNLWEPANEHAMPLGRLSTGVLVWLSGRLGVVRWITTLQGPLALAVGILLVYRLVRRELGHAWYGLVAMAGFGISTVYQQAVTWFAASFSVLSMDTMLLALLAAQDWRQSRRWRSLGLCALWCALAPAWFASGILAGPLCCIYLVSKSAGRGDESQEKTAGTYSSGLSWFWAFAPLLGTLLFLAVSLPRSGKQILHLEHYDGMTAVEAFDPLRGLMYTGRSLVENLILGVGGFYGVPVPLVVLPFALGTLAAAAAWWWQRAPGRAFLILGLALIFGSYLLTYSARAHWNYEGQMNRPAWSRYHLLPHLGLTLFVVGGLPRWRDHWGLVEGGLSRQQVIKIVGLMGVLLLLQLPRGIVSHWSVLVLPEGVNIRWQRPLDSLAQGEALDRIEQSDALCRRHQIGAATARAALGWLRVPHDCPTEDNGQFLRGSEDPRPLSVEEARRLLGAK
jgi:hypothetical protein